jgi:hypothetical protein
MLCNLHTSARSAQGHSRRFAAMLQRHHTFQSGRLHRRQHRYHPHMNKRGSVRRSPVTPGDGRSDPIAAVRRLSRRANCCLTRRCALRGRVAQMSGAELGFASIRCMSIREATTADFRSESFHSRICHRIDPLSGPRPRIDYQWPF